MTLAATLIDSVASVTYTPVATLKILTCTIAADRQAQSTLIDIYGEKNFSIIASSVKTASNNEKKNIKL